jgi:hypothetical protein
MDEPRIQTLMNYYPENSLSNALTPLVQISHLTERAKSIILTSMKAYCPPYAEQIHILPEEATESLNLGDIQF